MGRAVGSIVKSNEGYEKFINGGRRLTHADELAAANRTIRALIDEKEVMRRELMNLRNRVNAHNNRPKNQRQEFV
jgi:hypothetical protein